MATYLKTWRVSGAIIRQRGHAFQVETHHNGRRKRETFKTAKEAESHAKRLLGAVGFARAAERAPGQPPPSAAKLALVSHLEASLGRPLTSDTPPGADKLHIATWHDADALLL